MRYALRDKLPVNISQSAAVTLCRQGVELSFPYSALLSTCYRSSNMSTTLQIGQVLRGRLGSYKLTQKLENSVWLAL